MKTLLKHKVLFATAFLFALLTSTSANAQRIMLTANIRAFGIEKVGTANNTQVDYTGTTSFSGNLRLLSKGKWALRLGAGVNNLNYTFQGDSLNTNYDAVRQNMTAYLGIEKHFGSGLLRPYLGMFVPITFNATDKITDTYNNAVSQFKDGTATAGLSLLGGLHLSLFKILRVGAEVNLGFSQFKEEVLDNLSNDPSSIKMKNLDFATEVSIGLAF